MLQSFAENGNAATISDVLEWFKNNDPDRSHAGTGQRERKRLRDLVAQELGPMLIADARAHHLLEFINKHATENAWTRKRWNGTIQRPFNFAAKLGLIGANPFRGLTFKGGKNGRDWTPEEYRALLRHADPCVRRFLIMLRFTGMRPGEIRGVTWPNVLPESRVIVLDRHKTFYRTGKPRFIPLNTVAQKLLAWIRRNTRTACCGQSRTKYVFLNSFFEPWSGAAINKRLRSMRREIGLPEDVRLHGGRHYFCTQAIINGVDVPTLAELVGHGTIQTTQRYVHMADKSAHLQKAAEVAVGRKIA